MKLEQTFDVDAPMERVWEALIDVEQVAPCLPGAAITEAGEDGTYEGTFSAKVGPASMSLKGTLKMEQVDEASHTATMQANGSNRRGQGGAKATIVSHVSEREGGGTKVDIATDYTITGALARLGRGGMIEDVGNRLLRDFASCLEQQLAYQQAAGGRAGRDRGVRAVRRRAGRSRLHGDAGRADGPQGARRPAPAAAGQADRRHPPHARRPDRTDQAAVRAEVGP